MIKVLFKLLLLANFTLVACDSILLPAQYLADDEYSIEADAKFYAVTIEDVNTYLSVYKKVSPNAINKTHIIPIDYQNETALYVINYEQGWEILSADKRAPRVLCLSKDGAVTYEDFCSDSAIAAVYKGYLDNISALRESSEGLQEGRFPGNDWVDFGADVNNAGEWVLYDTEVVEENEIQDHLTETRWGQDSPWNIRAPYTDSTCVTHCYTGCVPVAAAQTLYYLNQTITPFIALYSDCSVSAYIPEGASFLYLEEDDVTFDDSLLSTSLWEYLPLDRWYTSNYYSTVSTLMVKIGQEIQAKYMVGATSAYIENVKYVFYHTYGIDSSASYNIDFDQMINEIYYDRLPSILGITRQENGVRYGHCVIADASRVCRTSTIKKYRKRIPPLIMDDGSILPGSFAFRTETEESELKYVGINWGWDGSWMTSNGSTIWFSTDALAWSVGNRSYTSFDYILHNFSIVQSCVTQ